MQLPVPCGGPRSVEFRFPAPGSQRAKEAEGGARTGATGVLRLCHAQGPSTQRLYLCACVARIARRAFLLPLQRECFVLTHPLLSCFACGKLLRCRHILAEECAAAATACSTEDEPRLPQSGCQCQLQRGREEAQRNPAALSARGKSLPSQCSISVTQKAPQDTCSF